MTTRILSNTKSKQMTLTTPEYLLSNYSQGGVRTTINLQSDHKYTSNYRQDLNTISNILQHIITRSVDNIDLSVDTVLVKDVELKTKLIRQLQITEFACTTTQTLRPLSPQMVQTAKDTLASQKEVTALIASFQKNITNLSIKDCKKIQVALARM
jgi:hypothetical protein